MSDIEVGEERREQYKDARTPIVNTKLASALLTMGFQLAPQPFTTVLGKRPKTTIYFIPAQKLQDGRMLTVREIEVEWCKSESETYPWVVWMRKALEARDYLLKNVVYGHEFPKTKDRSMIVPSWIVVDDLKAAATLKGLGYKLEWYADRRFYFSDEATKDLAEYLQEQARPMVAWMRCALRQQDILMAKVNDQIQRHSIVKVRNEKGETLTIREDAPDEVRRSAMRELMRGGK